MKILLVEDNRVIAQQLIEFLEGHKWQVDYAERGQQGLSLAEENVYDLVVLDLNLPDIDGVEICRRIKEEAEVNIPVLMLTARDAFEDKAVGFGHGADDYVTKPFEFRELALRCQALTRRNQLHQSKTIQVGELRIDQQAHKAERKGKELKLTSTGFKILLYLAQAHPNAVSRSAMLHHVWGDDLPDSDALRSHIYALRSVLDKPFDFPMLTTITSVGYKLNKGAE